MIGVPFYDGTAQVSQCPLRRNQSQQIDFAVREQAGSYWYHDHRSMVTADGLLGALVVRGPKDEQVGIDLDRRALARPRLDSTLTRASRFVCQIKDKYGVVDDVVLLVQDWFTADSVSQSKGLNQPFPLTANQTGDAYFEWVGTPRSLLLNWKGCADDCTPPVGNATAQTCSPDPACDSRYFLDVSPAADGNSTSSIRVRLIGAGSLLYQIVCFENHEVTVIETVGVCV